MQLSHLFSSSFCSSQTPCRMCEGKPRRQSGFVVKQYVLSLPRDLHKLNQIKNKDYYRVLINKEQIELKANSKWERDLQIRQTSLKPSFSRVKNVCRDDKLREFYFKLLHRIVVTKKELFLFDLAENAKCIYCETNDSIIHTFHNCNWSQ